MTYPMTVNWTTVKSAAFPMIEQFITFATFWLFIYCNRSHQIEQTRDPVQLFNHIIKKNNILVY